jgi:hypothetical protein
LASLLAIINSGHIWATHYKYLNDESELRNFRGFLGQMAHVFREKASGEFKRRNQPFLLSLLSEFQNDSNVYIASFSSVGDDLTQWRAYSPSSSGVSIGFDSRALTVRYVTGPTTPNLREVSAVLEKVRYMDERWTNDFFKNLDRMREAADKGAAPFRRLTGFSTKEAKFRILSAWLATAAPLYKHPSFTSEREWRIVVRGDVHPKLHVRFRPGRSTLIPYLEAVLNRGPAGKPLAPFFIRRVVVGPTPNMNIALAAIRSLFDTIGQPNVEVEPSQIPFRHW